MIQGPFVSFKPVRLYLNWNFRFARITVGLSFSCEYHLRHLGVFILKEILLACPCTYMLAFCTFAVTLKIINPRQ